MAILKFDLEKYPSQGENSDQTKDERACSIAMQCKQRGKNSKPLDDRVNDEEDQIGTEVPAPART
jgi:hypothetical protein